MMKGGPVRPTELAWKYPINAPPTTALAITTPGCLCGPRMMLADKTAMMTAVMPQ